MTNFDTSTTIPTGLVTYQDGSWSYASSEHREL